MSTVVPFHVVIPARYASSRLPGKPLAELAGRAMILHVVDRALAAEPASVIVATDDERIARCVAEASPSSVRAVLTSAAHPSGSDRVMEAARTLGLADEAIVVNVQGDEPLLPPEAIRTVARALATDPALGVATLSETLTQARDLLDPNVVKVVTDDRGGALYFSRSPIPYPRAGKPTTTAHWQAALDRQPGCWQRHVGVYGYRLATLQRFVARVPAAIEETEALEQLRLLASGERIQVVGLDTPMPPGVDTPEDLARAEAHLQAQPRAAS